MDFPTFPEPSFILPGAPKWSGDTFESDSGLTSSVTFTSQPHDMPIEIQYEHLSPKEYREFNQFYLSTKGEHGELLSIDWDALTLMDVDTKLTLQDTLGDSKFRIQSWEPKQELSKWWKLTVKLISVPRGSPAL